MIPPPSPLRPSPQVKQVSIPTGEEASADRLVPLLATLPIELRANMEAFIRGAFQVRPSARVCACVFH